MKANEDVFTRGLEEAVLSFVLRPVLAVVMLFPISEAYETHRKAEDAKIMEAGAPVDPSIVFFRQTVGNACGTIGLLHALANNVTDLGIESGSVVARILEEGKGKTPMERGKLLEKSNALADIHADMGTTGQTEAPAADSDVNLHFVCFVRGAEGHCWELDGRRPAAIDRGACDDLLTGAATVIQEYIDREEGNLNFVMLALCPAEE